MTSGRWLAASAGLLAVAAVILAAALPGDDVPLLWFAIVTVGAALAVLAVGIYVDARSSSRHRPGQRPEKP